MYMFGSGVLIGTPSGSNPTPLNLGLVQEVSLDVSRTLKTLYGQFADPLAVGAGTRKWTGKAKMARISGQALAQFMFGTTPSAGQLASVMGEAGTVPGVSTYIITVTNSATFSADLGVIYAATGLPLKRVASGPAIGQYSVSAGVYTFAAADASAPVLLSYSYTVSATGQQFTIASPLIGPVVTFGLNLYSVDPTTNATSTLSLYNCVSEKLTMGTKLEDFVMPELDFQCYMNAANNIGQFSTPDKF